MNSTDLVADQAEELNLQQVLSALGRRWSFVLAGLALGGLIAAWKTARTEPTWMGSFEIVLASKNQGGIQNGALSISPMVSNLINLSGNAGGGSELQTEVKILESASVLKPVFEELRAKKAALGQNISDYSFNTWASNLAINLQKGTSVLSISYQDTDKDLIIPVLDSLSRVYQTYSTKERDEALTNSIKYTKEQASIYRERSDTSFRELNSFALTYGIAPSNQTGGTNNGINLSQLLSSPNSTSAALEVTGNNSNSASMRPSGRDPLAQLAQLNQELIRQEQIFTANDPIIIELKRERDAVQKYIETSAFGSIAYTGKHRISKDEAQNILIRHQELSRKANRDQSTLQSLESALLSLQLEQSRASTPWQLISTPTLLSRPIAPRPVKNLAVGLAAGTILGCAAALIADQRSGKIFSKEQFGELLPAKFLLELPADQKQSWKDSLRLLSLSNSQSKSIAILPVGDIQPNNVTRIRDLLNETGTANVEICRTTLDVTRFESQLLLAAPGSIGKSDLNRLIQEIKIQQTPTIGWIWLDKDSINA